jgi:hypothetical protein
MSLISVLIRMEVFLDENTNDLDNKTVIILTKS